LAQLKLIAAVDITLKEPMQRLMAPLENALAKMAAATTTETRTEDFATIPIVKRTHPAGAVECSTELLLESSPPPPSSEASSSSSSSSEWTIHICPVPKKAARREAPGWKPLVGAVFPVTPGTVPVVCFNDTHFMALYSQAGATEHVTLECGTITYNASNGRYTYARVWVRLLDVPKGVNDFSATMRLSPAGTLTLAMCNLIHVIAIDDPKRTLVLRMKTHVVVTAVFFCDESSGLTWGTQCGESFYCNATTLEDMQTILTPLEEPVLSVQRDAANGGRWIVMTWMSVVGRLSPGAPAFKALPMERPLAVAARGPLMFVLTKYGKLDVYRPGQANSPLRGLLKVKPIPPMVTQYAYSGLCTIGERGLAALMPSGQVHYFEWE
jgi:hypothetical protein